MLVLLLALAVIMAVRATPVRLLAAHQHAQAAFTPPTSPSSAAAVDRLVEFLADAKTVVTITGAGISTESNIPDYRSPTGSYSRGFKPMVHDEFISKAVKRNRYWARSMLGYSRFSQAVPNAGHRALAAFEHDGGRMGLLITQNVGTYLFVCLVYNRAQSTTLSSVAFNPPRPKQIRRPAPKSRE